MNYKQLSENFINGDTKGGASEMFIDGNTIYSYSHNFPIAVRYSEDTYLYNSINYTKVTTQQQRHVYNAIPHSAAIIKLRDCDLNRVEEQIYQDIHNIGILQCKYDRTRSDSMKKVHIDNINKLKTNIELLKTLQ